MTQNRNKPALLNRVCGHASSDAGGIQMKAFLGALASLVWTLLIIVGVYLWLRRHHSAKSGDGTRG